MYDLFSSFLLFFGSRNFSLGVSFGFCFVYGASLALVFGLFSSVGLCVASGASLVFDELSGSCCSSTSLRISPFFGGTLDSSSEYVVCESESSSLGLTFVFGSSLGGRTLLPNDV